MTTKPRNIFPNNLYHIYNRAAEKRIIFYTEKDYSRFIEKIFFYKQILKIKILSYVILPNHFHLLLEEPDMPTPRVTHPTGRKISIPNISKFVSLLSNSYTKYFNYNKNHSGRLFEGPFKSKIVDNDLYLQKLIAYINLNPIKHKLVENIKDWPYVSHFELLKIINTKLIDKNDLIDTNIYKTILKHNAIESIKKIDIEFD